MTKFEAAVIGAGPTGLAAALALARLGIDVALVAPKTTALERVQPSGAQTQGSAAASAAGAYPRPVPDRRTTALMTPSIQLLLNLGVWDECMADAAPIAAVRIADDRGGLFRAPEVVFEAAEIGLESFGANLPNLALLRGLGAAAGRAPRLTQVATAAVTAIAPGPRAVRLTLAEGGVLEAALAVAADGRTSRAPGAAGIAVRTWEYPQTAIVASFAHSRPHKATVNELHRHAGPLTTVPLPGQRSALVWVEGPDEARRLAGLDDVLFASELEERLQGVLGTIADPEPRAAHPLGGRWAERMAQSRVALVGEAAHVVPPIGAQGLNLGLRDAAALADCVAAAKTRGEDVGGEATLGSYRQARSTDLLARSLSIDLLNRSLLADVLPVDMLRGLATHAVGRLGPLRRLIMQEGLGVAGPLPSLMR